MATANPIEDLLSTDIDESEVSALVGSLESRLASPTHKVTSHQITESSVNSNHVSNVLNVSTGSSNSHFNTSQGQKVLQSHGSSVINNSLYGENLKSTAAQILGIPSILNSTNTTNNPGGPLNINNLNTSANSHVGTRASGSSSGNIMLVPSSHTPPHHVVSSHTPPHATIGPNGNITYAAANNRASPQTTSVLSAHNIVKQHTSGSGPSTGKSPSAMYNLASIAAEQKPLVVPVGGINSKVMGQDQMDKKTVITCMSNSPISSKAQYVVKQEVRQVKSESNTMSHQNVHVVKGVTSNNPGSPNMMNPSRTVSASGGAIMRPQIITTQTSQSNGAGQMTVVNVNSVGGMNRMPNTTNPQGKTIQTTRVNAPIRIAAAPQQINIAPRLGTNTITLPGLQLPPGTIMMKNEQGQFVLMSTGGQQAGLPTQQSQSGPLPSGKVIQTIKSQPRSVPQTVVTIQQPQGSNVLHPHPNPTGTPPHHLGHAPIPHSGMPTQTIVHTQPGHNAGASIAPGPSLHPGSSAASQQQAMEHVKKCKNFLSTLIKLASSQPPQTIRNVRELIQRLIDGKVEPEQFTEKLQVELNSSPQPNLVPFLKKSLPLLRQSLVQNKMTIEGVKAPPAEILQGPPPPSHSSSPVSLAARPHLPHHTQTIQSPHGQVKHIVRQVTHHQLAQMRAQKPVAVSTMPGQPGGVRGPPGKAGLSGAMPTTVSALQARMGGRHQDAGGGAQHKEKRKFESLKDADDDINDVATMGGVNLSEESKNILATNADFIGTHIRSCKDELFLNHGPLLGKINSIAKKYGITDIPSDVVNLVSHATQERLRNIAERLSTIAEHRTEIYRMDSRFEVTQDTRTQIKFLEEIDKLEKKRHEEQEREILLRAAKSRSKTEDPEQAKLKQKAKELQLAEAEELRQEQANKTALAAIGPRKKKKLDTGESSSSTGLSNGVSSTSSRSGVSNRPRIKRVNLKDLVFLMEQEKDTRKSTTLYKAFLK